MYVCIQELEVSKWESVLHGTAALVGEKEYVPPMQLAADLIPGTLKLNCVDGAVAEKHYINIH